MKADNCEYSGQRPLLFPFVEGNHYMEIEATVQPHHTATVKVLIPHHLILAVVDSPQKNIIGFDYKEPDKENGSH